MVTEKYFDTLYGQVVKKYTLRDTIEVDIVTCGATLLAARVPDKFGNKVDVLLGLNSAKEIVETTTYMGSVVGRCANRIGNGEFEIDGKKYYVAKNDNGKAHLHGGNMGFNRKIFEATANENSVTLACHSDDGEENYPANLDMTVRYTLNGATLTIEYFAQSDGKTLCNPTNHAYFNLNGQGVGDILNHQLTVYASKFLPVDENLIPTGEERSVKDTPFDFTSPKEVGRDIFSEDDQLALGGGYDHNFCLNGSHAATLFSPQTGIAVDCYTDRCGIQIYSGNFLDGLVGKAVYGWRSGICLETQYYPNAINNPNWESPLLDKGEQFYSVTKYVFSVKN